MFHVPGTPSPFAELERGGTPFRQRMEHDSPCSRSLARACSLAQLSRTPAPASPHAGSARDGYTPPHLLAISRSCAAPARAWTAAAPGSFSGDWPGSRGPWIGWLPSNGPIKPKKKNDRIKKDTQGFEPGSFQNTSNPSWSNHHVPSTLRANLVCVPLVNGTSRSCIPLPSHSF